jgi:hypothetical protein
VHKKYWSENLKLRDRLEDQGVYGSPKLIWMGCEDLEWIHLA